jgi:malonyl-CoA/methylmalonyl-CoA synthetase
MESTILTRWIDQSIERYATNTAITFLRKGQVETALTYAQLGREISACASRMADQGIGQGDRVIIFMSKSLDAVIAHLAAQKIGAVSILLNPGYKTAEMIYLIDDSQPRLVLCDQNRGEGLKGIHPHASVWEVPTHQPFRSQAQADGEGDPPLPDLSPHDAAVIIYTSGTTGNPKGAVLTHRNLTHDAANIIATWEIDNSDVLCHALPLFHIHGLCFALHTALLSGARILMLDAFDADTVLSLLARSIGGNVCTIFMAVPAMYARLMDCLEARFNEHRPDFRHLRLLASGSAPLSPQSFARIQELFGQAPLEREGMSETGMNFSNPLHGRRVPGSIGLPLPGLQVRIVDPQTGGDVDDGQVGEIWLRGPSITPGYWRKPDETRKTFYGEWFRTGDLGCRDQQGYYYLTDRIKHIIITGGENVSAREVESIINTVAGVVESAVVGLPDLTWGERVAAAVVARPGVALSAAQIQAACKRQLHDWKCPKSVEFVAALPRNTMGKVLKEEIKKIFES